jgi:hypothetical protein
VAEPEEKNPKAIPYYREWLGCCVRGTLGAANRQGLLLATLAVVIGLLVYRLDKGWDKAVEHLGHWALYGLAPLGLLFLALLLFNIAVAPLHLARRREAAATEAQQHRDDARAERDLARDELGQAQEDRDDALGRAAIAETVAATPNYDFRGSTVYLGSFKDAPEQLEERTTEEESDEEK